MRIRMLETRKGAEDGFTLKTYSAGATYDLRETAGQRDLAKVFVAEKWAEEVAPETSPVIDPAAAAAVAGAIAGSAVDIELERALDLARAVDLARPVYRLPLLAEFVAAGRAAADYDTFIKSETAEAEKAGFRVEVRDPTEAELAASAQPITSAAGEAAFKPENVPPPTPPARGADRHVDEVLPAPPASAPKPPKTSRPKSGTGR